MSLKWSLLTGRPSPLPPCPNNQVDQMSHATNCCPATLFYPSLGPEEAGEGWALSFILHALLGMPLFLLLGTAAPVITMAVRPGQVWPARDLSVRVFMDTRPLGLQNQTLLGRSGWHVYTDARSPFGNWTFSLQNGGGFISHTGCKKLFSGMIFDLNHHSQFCLYYLKQLLLSWAFWCCLSCSQWPWDSPHCSFPPVLIQAFTSSSNYCSPSLSTTPLPFPPLLQANPPPWFFLRAHCVIP